MIEFDLQMLVMLCLIGFTVVLFVSEIVSIDVAAMSILVLLGLLTLVPGFEDLIEPGELFAGFSSNAVIAIMATMVIGVALDRVGLIRWVSNLILRFGGGRENRIAILVCAATAFISSFMQNIGTAALFTSVVSRVSSHTGIAISRLMMPMGFCAILGGTLTMIGSGPLILLNDLMSDLNKTLPDDVVLQPLDLFAVTPIGLGLVAAGLLYFAVIGRRVLPRGLSRTSSRRDQTHMRIKTAYGLNPEIFISEFPPGHSLAGQCVADIEDNNRIHIIAIIDDGPIQLSPPRDTLVPAETTIALIGSDTALSDFAERWSLELSPQSEATRELLPADRAGFAEIVIPAESKLAGQSIAQIWLRKNYHLAGLAINRGSEIFNHNIRKVPLQAGDTLLTYGNYDAFADLQKHRDFIPISAIPSPPPDEARKAPIALLFLFSMLALVITTKLPLGLCLWFGALGMILAGIVTMKDAYAAISWQTVFLLACLMPLGRAVESSKTAAWLAQGMVTHLGDLGIITMQVVVALLATFLTLVISNIGATVLLVPLAVNLAISLNADPMLFALIVAISTSNSFLLPTNQVSVLIKGPGGYRVADFLRVGGGLTVIYIAVEISLLNMFF